MKKLTLLAAFGVALFAAGQANAQEVVVAEEAVSVTTYDVPCKNHYIHDWHKNWFIQVGAGAHLPFVEDTRFGHHWYKDITATYNLGAGHWFSPYLGFRFTALYTANHSASGLSWSKSKNANLNFELMWDALNSLGGVNSERVFSIIPFVGFGGAFTWDFNEESDVLANAYDRHGRVKDNVWTMPVTAGIQLRFRLCKYVDFFAEGRFVFYSDEWNRWTVNRPFDVDAVALGGFNFNIGGREFQSINPCDYLDQIAALNNQVNDLRGALATTAAALAAAEAQLPCPEVAPVVDTKVIRNSAPMLSCVRFKINSAVVTEYEEVNVYNVAKYMEANPGVNVIIRGYADKDTGTAAYNMKLSERRAQSVYDMLVNKYGIDSSRLRTEQFGSDVQPYEINNWNRIVIFTE